MEIDVNVKYEIWVTTKKRGKVKRQENYTNVFRANERFAELKKEFRNDNVEMCRTWNTAYFSDTEYKAFQKAMSDAEINMHHTRDEIIYKIKHTDYSDLLKYINE